MRALAWGRLPRLTPASPHGRELSRAVPWLCLRLRVPQEARFLVLLLRACSRWTCLRTCSTVGPGTQHVPQQQPVTVIYIANIFPDLPFELALVLVSLSHKTFSCLHGQIYPSFSSLASGFPGLVKIAPHCLCDEFPYSSLCSSSSPSPQKDERTGEHFLVHC